jgi:hypothetical protein
LAIEFSSRSPAGACDRNIDLTLSPTDGTAANRQIYPAILNLTPGPVEQIDAKEVACEIPRPGSAGTAARSGPSVVAGQDGRLDYVYLWVDGIHLGIRLDQGKLCLLVLIGARADGRKELVALADGHRESAESWADLPRDCSRRGMRAPVLAIGDGRAGILEGGSRGLPPGQGGPLLVP